MLNLTRTLLSVALVIMMTGPVMAMNSVHKFNNLQKFSLTCANAIAPLERIGAMPSQLLQAIALTESGRWDKNRRVKFAWPWTVTSGGSGKYFDTRQQAIDHVRALQVAV
jgi:hypothetical protein